MVVARSLAYAIGQIVSTGLFAPLAIIALVIPYRWRYWLVIQWTYFNLWWLEKTCGLTHVAEGLENIPDRPTVVLCKHQSAWETMALPRYFHPQVWVVKRELLWVPLFGWGLATLNPIAIDRSAGHGAISQILEQGASRLDDGIWVVIFPEGTRVAPGQRGRYGVGGALLAHRTGCSVVPVAHDSGDYWPRNSFLKFPGRIRLVIGPLITTAGRTPEEINGLAEDWIERTVTELRAGPAD